MYTSRWIYIICTLSLLHTYISLYFYTYILRSHPHTPGRFPPDVSPTVYVSEFLSNCGGERGSSGAHLPRGPVGKIIDILVYGYPKMDKLYNGKPHDKMDDLGGKPTILGKHPYPQKMGILKMIFLFPRWDMLVPWRVSAPGRWPELRLPRPRPCLWFASSGGYRIECGVGCRWIPWGDPGSVENQVGRLLKQGSSRWWQLKHFFIFTPKIGEDDPIWLIFFRWVGSTTNESFNWTEFLVEFKLDSNLR